MSVKVGVLGSAFDPPTLGHLDVMAQVAPQLDQLLLVPSAAHAFAKQMTPFAHRVEMLEQLIASHAPDIAVQVCTLEQQMLAQAPDHPVYTFDLLSRLEHDYRQQGQSVELFFVRGPDNADPAIWSRFYRADEIEQRWGILTAVERLAVRSSKVRALCAEAKSEDWLRQQLMDYLAPGVIDYVVQRRLYRH